MPLFYDKRWRTYNYIWREGGRQRWKSLGKDREVAKIKAQEFDRRRALGELAPLLVRTRIEDHLRWFLQYHVAKKRPRTQESYHWSIRKVLEFCERERLDYLDQLTRSAWEQFEKELLERYAVETRNDIFNILSLFLNLAVQNNFIVKNPLGGVKRRLRNPTRRRPKVFSDEEIGRLRAAASPQFRAIIDLMLLTGLRRGEVVTLEWRDIDLGRRTLTVQPKPDLGWIPKDYEVRLVDLPDQAVELLRRMNGESRFVFDTTRDKLGHQFVSARRGAGLEEGSPHTLRRTYASRLKDMGVDLRYIQGQLGHESLLTTERYLSLSGKPAERRSARLRYPGIDSLQAMPKQKSHKVSKKTTPDKR